MGALGGRWLGLLLLLWVGAQGAYAQPAAHTEQALQTWVAQVRASGKGPESITALMHIARAYDWQVGADVRETLAGLSGDARLGPLQQVLAKRLLARVWEHLGESAQAQELYEQLGFVSTMRVVGPFDNEGQAGWGEVFPPERDRWRAPDLDALFEGKVRNVTWRSLPSELAHRGYVALSYVTAPQRSVCSYAESFVQSPEATAWTLWFGAGGASKVFWNGQVVMRDATYRERAFPDRHGTLIKVNKGWNRLLVKVCVDEEPLGFYLRFGDRNGRPVTGLSFAETTPEALNIASGEAVAVRLLQHAPLAQLESALQRAERAAGGRRVAEAQVALARYLAATGSDDGAVRRAGQLARQAAQSKNAPLEWLLLAAQLADERAEQMRFVALARARYPKAAEVALAEAQLRASGPVLEEALPLLARVPAEHDQYLSAQILRAQVLRDSGLASAAYRLLGELREQWGDLPALLRIYADVAASASHMDEAIAARGALLAQRHDDVASRRVLVADALQRGDVPQASEHLDRLRAYYPGSPSMLRYLARSYNAMGRDDLALAIYREAMIYRPDGPEAHFAYARALLKAEQIPLARDALEEVLRLSPQHAGARNLLEHLQPSPRRDEKFAVPAKALLARRRAGDGQSTTVLQQLQVNTVFDNGLGTRFTQWAAQAHDEEGARELRTHSIQYDPETQRVDVRLARVYRADGTQLQSVRAFERQLGEPWYRLYYDTRALTVVFPDLAPGDTVELRYRVDDIAQRNRFADYFGDFHFLAGFAPTAHHEYVLITPEQRTFYVHAPELAGLQHDTQVRDGQRVQRWVRKDVPPLQTDPGMPGMSEVSPYLHVSTYQTWEEVGRWYWGLIHEQLYADASLKRTVAELMQGADTVEEKVRRIQHWVIEHTRYVGLEFGIHGFLPYRVPLVVQRGFGDCKDKASLLYTMLKEAGVDARIVLLRTRRNGQIADLPASLAVFDHAIAYVPALDLFIDGTAEHSGLKELPVQDQGVTVLVVGPESAQLTKTPEFGPEQRKRTVALEAVLSEDGAAQLHGAVRVEGTEAAGYRARYEAQGTRKERMTRSMASSYPGITLDSLRFAADFGDVDRPVRFEYDATVPHFAELHGGQLRATASTLQNLVGSLAPSSKRLQPLDLESRNAFDEVRKVVPPQGFVPVGLPAGGVVKTPFFELSLKVQTEGSTVVVETHWQLLSNRIAAQDYGAFRRRVQEADRLLRQQIGFAKGQ